MQKLITTLPSLTYTTYLRTPQHRGFDLCTQSCSCTLISLLLWIPCVVFLLTSLFKWGRPLINSFQTADLPVSDRQPYTTRIIYLQALNHIVSSWCSSALSWRNKQSVFKPSNDWDLPWLTNSISFEVASDN